MFKQAIALCAAIFVVLFGGCEKSEPFTFNEFVHRVEAVASSGDNLVFSTSFSTVPDDRSGLHSISAHSFATGAFNKPPLLCIFRVVDFSIGCKALRFTPGVPTGEMIDYSHVRVAILEDDQILGNYMLREDMESQICIDEFLQGGREMLGTFELHMYRERASFPWLETNWPDSLSIVTQGQFRAFGFI